METLNSLDNKWMQNLEELKMFCGTYLRFPRAEDKFNGTNIGYWFMYQRKLHNKNQLSLDKIIELDKLSPLWKGSLTDLRTFKNHVLANKIVNEALEDGFTPITELIDITKEELYNFILQDQLTCESLLSSDEISMDIKYRALATIHKDLITINYLRLLNDIKSYNNIEELYNEIEIDKLRQNIDDAIEYIKEDDLNIIDHYYGLSDGKFKTLRDVGEIVNMSHENIRKLIMKDVKALSTPYIVNKFLIRGSNHYYNQLVNS